MLNILIHYSEIALKGLNRSWFEGTLAKNISESLGGKYEVIREDSRIIIKIPKTTANEVTERLKKIFGISWFSIAYSSSHEINEMEKTILEKIRENKIQNEIFRVEVNRAYKKFPVKSMDLAKEIAEYLDQNGIKTSPVRNTKTIYVEILKNNSFITIEKIQGLNGLPTGTSGKCLHLLSGGIDSPVAAWLLMKRGIKPLYVHFHPFREGEAKTKGKKIIEFVKLLSQYSLGARLYLVPFYPFQIAALKIPQRNAIILFRRLMLKIAEKIAQHENAMALSTGESVAQVASQTLANINVIEESTSMPVLRPLITHDKNEIVELAKKLGSYEISLKQYNDCCISLISRHPVLKANLNTIKENEEKIKTDKLVDEMFSMVEVVKVQ